MRTPRIVCTGLMAVGLAAGTACGGGTSTTAPTSPASHVPSSSAPATQPAPGTGPCGTRTGPVARYEHVVWIWMENHTFDQVIGNADAPYETGLAAQCGTATDYAEVGSPSLPNYIGATSGDIQGIHDDASPSTHRLTVDNVFRQVRSAGGTEKSYQDSMPANCVLDSQGMYAVKHNPAAYYVGGDDRASCLSSNVPLGSLENGELRHDLDTNTLPTFSFVTPNLCNDTHDCGVSSGDQWLRQWVPVILASSGYRAGGTAVFVVWDEPTRMPFIVISPTTPPGTKATNRIDHYALLRTTEAMLGIGTFLGRAATAPDLRPALGL
jgi:phospholipase C